jgi:hypothetical protein
MLVNLFPIFGSHTWGAVQGICELFDWFAIFDIKSSISFKAVHANSLKSKTGNVFRQNRELIRLNREQQGLFSSDK